MPSRKLTESALELDRAGRGRRLGSRGGRLLKLWTLEGGPTFVQRSSTTTPQIAELDATGALVARLDDMRTRAPA